MIFLFSFILVILASFILALLSMRNFQENPKLSKNYTLYLIRKTANIEKNILDHLHSPMLNGGIIISFERLFKGSESTLVIFTPKELIQDYIPSLDLLELEDYADLEEGSFTGFEMGVKGDPTKTKWSLDKFFTSFPKLWPNETVWWQLVLKARKDSTFETLPRMIISSAQRREELEMNLKELAGGTLAKVPKPYSSSQMLSFYKDRSLNKSARNPILTSKEVLDLIILN